MAADGSRSSEGSRLGYVKGGREGRSCEWSGGVVLAGFSGYVQLKWLKGEC